MRAKRALALGGQGGEVSAMILGILLAWFAASVFTALVAGHLVHRGAEDRLEDLLAAEYPDLWVRISISLGRPASAAPKNSSGSF